VVKKYYDSWINFECSKNKIVTLKTKFVKNVFRASLKLRSEACLFLNKYISSVNINTATLYACYMRFNLCNDNVIHVCVYFVNTVKFERTVSVNIHVL
jgi:hypothetical protein